MTTALLLTHSDLSIVLAALMQRVNSLESAAQAYLDARSSDKSREANAALYVHAESLRQRASETQAVYLGLCRQDAAVHAARALGGV